MAESDRTPEAGRAADAGQELAERMGSIHIARIDEMPRIELYLDQVLSIVCNELSFMALPGEELLTGSMVNNYVKKRVVPPPVRRRYTRRHVATLIFVCAFKRVFSISEVHDAYEACVREGVDVASTYDELVGALERTLATRFGGEGPDCMAAPQVALRDASGAEVAPGLALVMSAGVEAVADKVYVEQMIRVGRL